jgi:two-component system chemotaxis sensor kinase CheA
VVERLGGHVRVFSEPGQGTKISIRLPVTLATLKGILVRISDEIVIIPSGQISRIVAVDPEEVKTVGNRSTISLDGQVLPVVPLADVLQIPSSPQREQSARRLTAVVLNSGERQMAFMVDEILREEEILAKGLGRQLGRVHNFAGATILGRGKVVLIVNPYDLLKTAEGVISRQRPAASDELADDSVEKSVLVVEDSFTSRTLLRNILESAGYIVETAVDGQEAFATLRIDHYDLVVSDVQMPRMDGFELTENIRADERLSETPVILVTSLDRREDRERGIDAGANAYIIKSSFEQKNLLEVVDRFI